MLRILFSARDPGAAQAMVPVIRCALSHPQVDSVVWAQGPAAEILAAAGLPVRILDLPALPAPDAPGRDALLEAAGSLLESENPNAVVTGLSGPGAGIDEALLHCAVDRPRYSIQDFEGWVVPGFGRPAPTYFVADPGAADRTRRQGERFGGIRTVVVGSLKHSHYGMLDPTALRRTGRAALPHREWPLVGFYGQPAWQWPGYERSIIHLAQSLAARLPSAIVVYRPHPKESAAERSRSLGIFASAGLAAVADPNPAIEQSLCAVDLVTTCFSTCGIDHVHLQRRSPTPLGGVVFVMTEADLRDRLERETGLPVPWPAQDGLAEAALSAADLPDRLAAAIAEPVRRRAWERIRSRLEPAQTAPDTVIRHILDDLGALTASHPDRIAGGPG
ncbi:hypothetical protein FZ983_20055 [Azospirillum sp. B21]|uniref:hypothetical protein n=1 Tax=Azospirillum sp. B21 TaxID=2607496 RepID=UPI0011EE30E8|nr:hypothetical protein [Azospirillum sp. B21]KAA0577881.1 hypothetical protein FZ983_20055 [Azospirillum sp. B21]